MPTCTLNARVHRGLLVLHEGRTKTTGTTKFAQKRGDLPYAFSEWINMFAANTFCLRVLFLPCSFTSTNITFHYEEVACIESTQNFFVWLNLYVVRKIFPSKCARLLKLILWTFTTFYCNQVAFTKAKHSHLWLILFNGNKKKHRKRSKKFEAFFKWFKQIPNLADSIIHMKCQMRYGKIEKKRNKNERWEERILSKRFALENSFWLPQSRL